MNNRLFSKLLYLGLFGPVLADCEVPISKLKPADQEEFNKIIEEL